MPGAVEVRGRPPSSPHPHPPPSPSPPLPLSPPDRPAPVSLPAIMDMNKRRDMKAPPALAGDRPRIYMSNKTHNVVVVFPNGEIVQVANPPERAKDDSTVGTQNGQLSRTGSLTVLRRTNSRKTTTSSSRASSISMDSIDSYASADLGVDKLPPVDTSEALHACSLRNEKKAVRSEVRSRDKKAVTHNYVESFCYGVRNLESKADGVTLLVLVVITGWVYHNGKSSRRYSTTLCAGAVRVRKMLRIVIWSTFGRGPLVRDWGWYQNAGKNENLSKMCPFRSGDRFTRKWFKGRNDGSG
ncbi:hypothetical protein RRG08_005231 [Elysia crispata]|uniref:Uncharacterized protein n=1 Tax=Elysia crispata TaxID=231223 RepID=A0AAE1AMY8_9GAST|nr:hypothetical protein RRG08_005231 [Elysia crispata]